MIKLVISKPNWSKSHPLNDIDLMCSLTQDLFVDPVVTCDGNTYSRTSIERWFNDGHDTSPNTGVALKT